MHEHGPTSGAGTTRDKLPDEPHLRASEQADEADGYNEEVQRVVEVINEEIEALATSEPAPTAGTSTSELRRNERFMAVTDSRHP